jgi:hypothetical protein
MLDQTGKFLPGENTLAYLASSSAMKKKCFITLTPVSTNVIINVILTNVTGTRVITTRVIPTSVNRNNVIIPTVISDTVIEMNLFHYNNHFWYNCH